MHISAISNAVCMHDSHRPDMEGPPHASCPCAVVVGANEDTGEAGHIECANGYPMDLVARRTEERIECDENRPELMHMRLARNCPLTVGGNKFMRFAAGSNEATKIITHRRGAIDYVAKYQTDGEKAGGGEKDSQVELVNTLDKMSEQDKLFGVFLTSSFMKLMGNAAFPITKVFHYLMKFPTASFSRAFKLIFLQGQLNTDDAKEALQSVGDVREDEQESSKKERSDVARFEKRLELFDASADDRTAAAAMIPGTAPVWCRDMTVVEAIQDATLSEFLRLFEIKGGRLYWRSSPAILRARPILRLRFGGAAMPTHSKYALLLYKPNATRNEINLLSGSEAADILADLVAAPDPFKRHAYIRNLLREQNTVTNDPFATLSPLGTRQPDGDTTAENNQKEEALGDDIEVSVGYDGVVHHRKVRRAPRKKLTFEERLRAQAQELKASQSIPVPEDWMERSAENQFGSSAYVVDSDDDGGDDTCGLRPGGGIPPPRVPQNAVTTVSWYTPPWEKIATAAAVGGGSPGVRSEDVALLRWGGVPPVRMIWILLLGWVDPLQA